MQFLKVLFILWVLPWLSACQGDEPAFKVGINRWLGYEPLYLAKQLEFYPDIDIVRLSSSLDVLRALRNGNLQGAGLTLDETLTLLDEGIDLDIILVLDYSSGADVVTAAPGMQSLQDLKGKRIAVEMNAAGAFMLHSMLRKAQLGIEQVSIESMPISHMAEAYANGRIDAAVSYSPHASALILQGMHTLFSSADIPGQIVDVLVVRKDSLYREKHIKQLVAGYFRTQAFLAGQPEAALLRMSADLGTPVEDLRLSLKGIHWPSHAETRAIMIDTDEFTTTARQMVTLMRELKMIDQDLQVQAFIDSRWLHGYTP